jgi:hypothetical protein
MTDVMMTRNVTIVERLDILLGTAQSLQSLARKLLAASRRTAVTVRAKRKRVTIVTQMQKNSQLNASVGRKSARCDFSCSLSLGSLPIPTLLNAL